MLLACRTFPQFVSDITRSKYLYATQPIEIVRVGMSVILRFHFNGRAVSNTNYVGLHDIQFAQGAHIDVASVYRLVESDFLNDGTLHLLS